MKIKPAASHKITRREFLKQSGQLLAGGVIALGAPTLLGKASLVSRRSALPDHPNLLIIITDQERTPQHWPADWAATNLTNRKRLAEKGITFQNNICNSAMCSPSRANLFTGLYPTQHGVGRTITYGGSASGEETSMPVGLPNLATMLASIGYQVVLKGKWHLSKNAAGQPPSAADVARYGFQEWTATTAGEATDPVDFGGGCADNDTLITEQALEFLNSQTPQSTATQPFCLIVSLVNPHDVLSYPQTWNNTEGSCHNYQDTANFSRGIALPNNYDDDLNKKPTCQKQSRDLYAALGTLLTDDKRLKYVNFYADLQDKIDDKIGQVLDKLASQELTNSTLVVRVSDHGEMGLSHDGLRQKMFNVYEESLRVPLVISNPLLFPNPVVTQAFSSLVDVAPTLAALVGVPVNRRGIMRGFDLSPILADPQNGSVQNTVVYTFDDQNAGLAEPQSIVQQPNHIRCIRHKDTSGVWKYARYFDPAGIQPQQYEMYHLTDGAGIAVDPGELDNLANSASPNYSLPEIAAQRITLAEKLAEMEATRLAPLSWGYLPAVLR